MSQRGGVARFSLGGWALVLAALSVGPWVCSANAATFTGGVGYDYQGGPNGLRWNTPLAFSTITGERKDATIMISRYHSSDVGWGWSGLANVGLASKSGVGARVIGSRSIGDGEYWAWRLQAGPIFALSANRSLYLYGAHFEDSQSGRLNQIGGETYLPMGSELSGLLGGMLGEWQDNASNAQVTAGLTWSRWRALQVIGQLTFGKNIAASSTLAANGGAGGPFGASGHGHNHNEVTGETPSDAEAAVFGGVRINIP